MSEVMTAVDQKTGKEFAICGAKNRNGVPCQNQAGKGTDHLGVGRCKFHGGKNQSMNSKVFKHGLNSQLVYPAILEKIEQLKQDRDVFDMRDHIYLLEAITHQILENAKNTDDLMPLVKVVDTATKAIQRLHEIEIGRKYVISVETVGNLIDRVVTVVERHIPDPYTRTLIAADLVKLVKNPNPVPLLTGKAIDVTDANEE